jgi:hypothetical protein
VTDHFGPRHAIGNRQRRHARNFDRNMKLSLDSEQTAFDGGETNPTRRRTNDSSLAARNSAFKTSNK